MRPPRPAFPKSSRQHRMLPSLIRGYSGPEIWRRVRSHGTFYEDVAYLSDRGRVLNWRGDRWRVIRPRTSKRRNNEGMAVFPVRGPDGKIRCHYLGTLANNTFIAVPRKPCYHCTTQV
jgi:hypothetical protein